MPAEPRTFTRTGQRIERGLRRDWEAAKKARQEEHFFEELTEAVEKGHIAPHELSIRALFENFIPDGREIVDSWDLRNGGSGGVNLSLLEAQGAVDTSAFSTISGQVLFTGMMEAYESEDFVFTKLVPTVSTKFDGEKNAGLSNLGDVSEPVGEGKDFPTVGFGEDWTETPQTDKRGLIVPLTKEAIFFDRTGKILDHARQVGESLGINKENRIIDCFIDENVTKHRYKWKGTTYATYQTTVPWINVTPSNGLTDFKSLDACQQTMNQLTDPHTGEPIVIGQASHLVVTQQNQQRAMDILGAMFRQSGTQGVADQGFAEVRRVPNNLPTYNVVSSARLAYRMQTDTDWFLGNPSKAFEYRENWPITLVESPPNSDDDFKRDIVKSYKASERGAASTKNPRYMHKNKVAA